MMWIVESQPPKEEMPQVGTFAVLAAFLAAVASAAVFQDQINEQKVNAPVFQDQVPRVCG
jgi:hypothetical protein